MMNMKKWIEIHLKKMESHTHGKLLVQFLKFGMIGVSNTGLSLITTYIILGIFSLFFHIQNTVILNISTTCGYVAGVLNSYYLNSRFVFKQKQETNKKRLFLKVFLCYGCTYVLSMILMDILVEYLRIPLMIAPIPRLLITIPLNFAANKYWAYKDK